MKKFLLSTLFIFLLTNLIQGPIRAESTARTDMIYFVMLDRFSNGNLENDTGALGIETKNNGLDKTNPGFYHGGDLIGLTDKIPYIKSLGFSAIWITPVVRQLSVSPDGSSASYHGYWGTGFNEVDAHLGTMDDFKTFVKTAHSNNLKVILDIVINHTADVIKYADGNSYISLTDKQYKDKNKKVVSLTQIVNTNVPIKLDPKISFPKTPFIYPSYRNIKDPKWLNDVTNYHNRGDSTFAGESSFLGDFFGLDDVFTEKPEVVKGFIEIYSRWITETGVDGFRIDTARHVNTEFWNQFLPAMRNVATKNGKEIFPMWAEIYDTNPNETAFWVKNADFSEVLDFPLQDRIINFIKNRFAMPLATLFNDDDYYLRPGVDVNRLGTFLGNHDMGRIGAFIGTSQGSDIALKQSELAHALLFTLRGTPIVYYGDEYGLTGGSDKDARQDLFPTQVTKWQIEPRIGQEPIGNKDSFSTTNPLQNTIRKLAALRSQNEVISVGSQKIRFAGNGIFAFSRGDEKNAVEFLFVFNSNSEEVTQEILTDGEPEWNLAAGQGAISAQDKSVLVNLPAYSWAAFRSNALQAIDEPKVSLVRLRKDPLNSAQLELAAKVTGVNFTSVNFLYKNKLGKWMSLGQDKSPTFSRDQNESGLFRVFPLLKKLPKSKPLLVKAEIKFENRTIGSQPKTIILK